MKKWAFCLALLSTLLSAKELPASQATALSPTALTAITNKQVAQRASSPYPTFNTKQLDKQLAVYQQHLVTSGTPDVLVVGSSRALQGVDPAVLQQGLAAQGYRGIKIYNFGVNGATAQVVKFVLRQLLTSDQLPQLIVWADGSRAFNSGRLDVTYNGIVASEGYRLLSKGIRPTVSQGEGLGFFPAESRFNPATYYQRYPRVAGLYDSDYKSFNLEGEQAAAFRDVVAFTQDRRIPLVFVNLPLTQDYLDSTRQRYEEQFQQQMQRMARENNFIYRDLSRVWLRQYGYFADPSHLNRYGAAAVSRLLAQDKTIPWKSVSD